MTDIISFPKLGLELEVNPVAFSIGDFQVRWYGILIALGLVLALIYVLKRAKSFGLNEDRSIDVILGGIVGGIVGARLYYVAFQWDQYKDNLLEIFKIREGGIAIYGGIIGGLLVGYFMCRWRKIKFAPMLDIVGLGFLIGQCIGRWGNFFNSEAFGSNTELPWGMTSDTIAWRIQNDLASIQATGMTVDPLLPVHPTFLYESLWCLIGFVLLHVYSKHRKFDGEVFTMYVGWYSLGRFFIEGLRTDSLVIAGTYWRVSQVLAGILVVASVITLVTIRSKIKRMGDPDYRRLYVETEESKLLLEQDSISPKKQSGIEVGEIEEEETIEEDFFAETNDADYTEEDKLNDEDIGDNDDASKIN